MLYSYLGIISAVVQIACIVHCVSRRSDYFWIFVILFFPFVGSAVYALVIWIPEARHSHAARGTSRAVLALFDPRRELRRRLNSLDVSDTVSNRVSLAGELVRHGMIKDALALYERSLTGVYEDDPYLLYGYATALYAAGIYADARLALEKLRAGNPALKLQGTKLLYARTLEQLGEMDLAAREYAAALQESGGMEAKCRYALFLKHRGQESTARELFQDILHNAKLGSSHSRRLNKEWIGTAKRELA